MKKGIKNNYIILILFGLLIFSACSKDDYYEDGGLAEAKFDGSILEYLDSKPVLFDTIAEIIRLAGLEETFNNDEFTFFAPSDPDIKDLIGSVDKGGLNSQLYYLGLDTITKLSDIDPKIWETHLLKYMFLGKNKLADYPQIDFSLLNIHAGQNYIALSGDVSNIGVVFNDAIGGGSVLKYMGYRQLHLSYYLDPTDPDSYLSYPISTSDIQPNNGVIHVLNYTRTAFGLDLGLTIIADIIQSKR